MCGVVKENAFRNIIKSRAGACSRRPTIIKITKTIKKSAHTVSALLVCYNYYAIFLYVILSEGRRGQSPTEVEVLRSDKRSKTEERMRRWDMAWSLGGFLQKSNIPLASHRDFKPYPCGATHLDFTSLSLGKISTTQIASQFSPLRMTGSISFVLLCFLYIEDNA